MPEVPPVMKMVLPDSFMNAPSLFSLGLDAGLMEMAILGDPKRRSFAIDRREIPPLRGPTRSHRANAKKRRRLASVGMTNFF
jgi:hypothetical protein